MIVTCLIGDPVEQSVSEYMYNFFAEKVDLNYSHVKFRIPSRKRSSLKRALQSLRVLNMRGANITFPFKIKVMKYLDEINKDAVLIGAVNLIVNKNGRLVGFNTDGKGALLAIEKHLKNIEPTDKIVVFGAGGAARAIIYEIAKRTQNITVINRAADFYLAKKLRKDFIKIISGIKILPLSNKNLIRTIIEADIIINATPVGMFPRIQNSLLSEINFSKINSFAPIKDKYFFDVVYNPYLTKFLSIAKRYKAKICPGLYMMIYQGLSSFKLWTGKDIQRTGIINEVHGLLKQKLALLNKTDNYEN